MSVVSFSKDADGIAVVTLANEPVNIMSMKLWKELSAVLDTLEADPEVRAIIIQSGLKKNVFTAGLDIKELYLPMTTKERFAEYWEALSGCFVKVYSSKKATASAIKGACPAGGCCLSLCCDYRVITADGSMGLNEVQLGLPVPTHWIDLFKQTTGHRQAELLLQRGDLLPAKELLALEMVDAVVDTADQVLPAARAEMQRWLKSPDAGRAYTKWALRHDLGDRWAAGLKAEVELIVQIASSEESLKTLGKTLERLGGGKKAPASKL